jgi:hypothetical protein
MLPYNLLLMHVLCCSVGAATAAEHAVQLSALDTELSTAAQLHSEVRLVTATTSVTAAHVTVLPRWLFTALIYASVACVPQQCLLKLLFFCKD